MSTTTTTTTTKKVLIKALIVGCHGVGKTSLLNRFLNNKDSINDGDKTTVLPDNNGNNNNDDGDGNNTDLVDFKLKTITIDDKKMKVQLFDVGDVSSINSYLRKTMAVFIVFDVNDESTFENVQNKWCPLIDDYSEQFNIMKIMIGNKIDLAKTQSNNYQSLIDDLDNDYKYFQVSCKDNDDNTNSNQIDEIFKSVLLEIYDNHKTNIMNTCLLTPRRAEYSTSNNNNPDTILSLDRTASNSKSYIDYKLEKKENKILDGIHSFVDKITTPRSPRSTTSNIKHVSIDNDDDMDDGIQQLRIGGIASVENNDISLFENLPQTQQQGLYSLNGLKIKNNISIIKFIKIFLMLFFYPITMIYQLLIFLKYNGPNQKRREMKEIINVYLPTNFDIFNGRHRIFYDILDPMIRNIQFDINLFHLDLSLDANDFMKQTPKQIFNRFVITANGILLYILMTFNFIWFCVHSQHKTTKSLHFIECIGSFILFLLLIIIISIWVSFCDYKIKQIDKFIIGLYPLYFKNEHTNQTSKKVTICKFLKVISNQIENGKLNESNYYFLNKIKMNMFCFVLSIIYSLLPSFTRYIEGKNGFIPSYVIGTWFIGFITNTVLSFIYIKIILMTIKNSFDNILNLMISITSIISINRDEFCHSGHILPFLDLINSKINIISWTQLRNYIYFMCFQYVKNIEILIIFNIFVFIVLSVLILFIDDFNKNIIDFIIYSFWILICFIGFYYFGYKFSFKMNYLSDTQKYQLLSQSISINHYMIKLNYLNEREIDGDNNNNNNNNNNGNFNKNLKNISNSINLLISYLDKNNNFAPLFNYKLHEIMRNISSVFVFCFLCVYVIIPVFFR